MNIIKAVRNIKLFRYLSEKNRSDISKNEFRAFDQFNWTDLFTSILGEISANFDTLNGIGQMERH